MMDMKTTDKIYFVKSYAQHKYLIAFYTKYQLYRTLIKSYYNHKIRLLLEVHSRLTYKKSEILGEYWSVS